MIDHRHFSQLSAMIQVSQQLSRDTDEAELLATFVRGAVSIAAAYRVRLVRNEAETYFVECEAQRSQSDEIIVGHRRPLVDSEESVKAAFHAASETGMPVLFGTTSFGLPYVCNSLEDCTLENPTLCVPLLNGERQTEILCLDRHGDAPPFDASLVEYLYLLAGQAAARLENVRIRACVTVEARTRREVEIALQANEKELAHTQRMSQTGSWRWHAIENTIEASPECYRIYDLPREQRCVSSEKFTELTHPDDLASVQIALGKAVAARRVFKLEFRIAVGFGEIKYVQIEGHPRIGDTENLQYVGVLVDVTERRNAENALQAARAELARAHRLSTMGEMAASIVHEIYQPLTGIVTNAEACLRWLSKSPTETARASDSVRRVVRDAHRATEVFKGLRAVASNAGIVKVPVDLDDAIREVAFLLQGELDRTNIRIRLQVGAQKPVLGDRTQIQQVLENLMRNAMDALLPVVDTQRFLVVSSAPHEAAFAMVTVEDNGCGFGEHSPEELFDALFTTKPNGMGMGLKVCRSIVEAHGGAIHAERREQDTVFQFTLPYIGVTR